MDVMSLSHGPKLTIPEQIEHMKMQGISFSIKTEEYAMSYLRDNNNYFKLRAYRKNYVKNSDGKYIGLEFAYLRDIAIIDMRIRYCLLSMCLDIEHNARVSLIKSVVDAANEDGYTVVADYRASNPDSYSRIIERASKSPYCAELQEKYRDSMPIWAIVEMMQFSDLCWFYRFVAHRISNESMLNEYYMFQEIRQLRNACAHSNCILNDLKSCKPPKHDPDKKMITALSQIKDVSKGVRQRKMSNDRIRQITTILYLYKHYVQSSGLQTHHAKQLHETFVRRFEEHSDYYLTSQPVLTTFEFFKKVIDNWYPLDV